MAEQKTRFIRVKGRIVPIKGGKRPEKKPMKRKKRKGYNHTVSQGVKVSAFAAGIGGAIGGLSAIAGGLIGSIPGAIAMHRGESAKARVLRTINPQAFHSKLTPKKVNRQLVGRAAKAAAKNSVRFAGRSALISGALFGGMATIGQINRYRKRKK